MKLPLPLSSILLLRKHYYHRSLISAQLAVLAAAAVVAAELRLFPIVLGLAVDAQAHAGNRPAPRLGDRRVALFAMGQALATGQLAARTSDGILDRAVDLFLHRTVVRPPAGHD